MSDLMYLSGHSFKCLPDGVKSNWIGARGDIWKIRNVYFATGRQASAASELAPCALLILPECLMYGEWRSDGSAEHKSREFQLRIGPRFSKNRFQMGSKSFDAAPFTLGDARH